MLVRKLRFTLVSVLRVPFILTLVALFHNCDIGTTFAQYFTAPRMYRSMPRTSATQTPSNGTLVLGNKHSVLGNYLSRRMEYSHVGIVLDGKVCESDWPHVKCTPIGSWQQSGTSYDWYAPNRPYTARETRRLRRFVNRTLGDPYQLKNYLLPGTPRTESGWCSTWAARALNRTGRYRISRREAWNPELLHNQVQSNYHYTHSTNQ